MKKILFMIESLKGGGAEKVLSTLVKNIDKTKYDITVFVIAKTGIYVSDVENNCRLLYALDSDNSNDSFLFKLKSKFIYCCNPAMVYKYLIKESYDIEIAFVEGLATKLVSNSFNKNSKKYAWVHTDLINNPWTNIVYKSIDEERECYSKFDKVLCVSSSVKNAFDHKYHTENSAIQYNLIDENEIIKKSKEISVQKQEHLQLITLGRLVPQKGYDRLIKCIKRIINEGYDNFNLWILGEGEQREYIEHYIKDNCLEKYITLLGFKSNPYPYLAASDAFICSSRSEGFSTVATEALILEKPIFTVDCAGMRELFANCECGCIVENKDESLYEMLKFILKQENFEIYNEGLYERISYFKLKKRIKEIENLFD